ncbi:MAG TPA: transporter [Oribacterium sp.]|jgi:AAA15 family ATPase/GTPase|nr:transporter [Oribacterium sp.]
MFEYVKLKNYKSFGNIEFNLLDRNNQPKKMVLIYGENGIGKSNLASAFFMLSETLRTMAVRDIMESLLADDADRLKNSEEFKKYFRMRYKDIETLIKENKTVSSTESMLMEFGFRIDGKSGKYLLEMNDSQIIHERLEYTLTQRRGAYYDITPEKATISTKIFQDRASYQAIKKACAKFWGKHSLLSILMHESDDKADQYIREQIEENFALVLQFFSRVSCKIKFGSRQERGIIGLPPEILGEYESGEIDRRDEEILNRTEKMLDAFLRLTYKDIIRAYYKRTYDEEQIQYQLVITKNIAGKPRDIDFALESTGTQSLIQQLPFMLVVVKGSVAVIDEFDTGIHDLLVKALATSLYDSIEGQLIMTTHNTLLMESDIPKECIYVINEVESGEKEIQCILHYNNKIGEKNNIRKQYLLGKYTGIPEEPRIDFCSLLNTLNDKAETAQ